MKTKIFISHASEDKADIARPLAEGLREDGFEVWYDEYSLTIGDSLEESIGEGITSCDFGVLIISSIFLQKPWTKTELKALFNKELGRGKVILPIWHNVNKNELLEKAPLLVDKLAASSDDGIPNLVKKIRIATTKTRSDGEHEKNDDGNLKIIFSNIQGKDFIQPIIKAFTEDQLIDIDEVESIRIDVSDDLSGVNEYDSFFKLRDGSRVPFSEEYILEATQHSHPIIQRSYDPVEWDIVGQANLMTDDVFYDFKDLEISIMFIEGRFSFLQDEIDRIKVLKSIIQVDTFFLNFGMETWRFEDGIFNGLTVCKRILNDLICNENIKILEDLIFDPSTKPRFAFILSKMFIEHFIKKDGEVANKLHYLSLIKRIGNSKELLNQHWKDKIQELFGKEDNAPTDKKR